MAQFFLSLPSDSSLVMYPENVSSWYKTHLVRPIHLEGGDWEVALMDLFYPKTWQNVREDEVKMTVNLKDKENHIILKHGVYRNVDEVIEELKKEMDGTSVALKGIVNLKRKKHSGKVHVSPRDGASMTHSPILGQILGHEGKVEIRRLSKSPYYPDVQRGMHNFFVYSDIVEPSLIGDTAAPLLRIIKADPTENSEEHGGLAHYTCQKPFYHPVAKANFQTLEMNIRDELGRNVAFEGGKVIATLHFRQRRSLA